MTKAEKIFFSLLTVVILAEVMILTVNYSERKSVNSKILNKIQSIQLLTDQTPLTKDSPPFELHNQEKLNLNKTDLFSIKMLTCLTDSQAEKIYKYVKKNHPIKDLKELLKIKGITQATIEELSKSATTFGGHAGQKAWGKKLDLNFATIEELSSLPGVGKASARKILEFRTQNLSFSSLADLYEIPGLSEKTIKSLIETTEVK